MAKLRQNMGKQQPQAAPAPVSAPEPEYDEPVGMTPDAGIQPMPGDDDDNKDYASVQPYPPRRGGGRRRRGLLADGGDPDEGSNDAGLS